MKILFLLPPSEGKNSGGEYDEERVGYNFEKPCEIAKNVTEKDLKCKGKRYEEGVKLNKYLIEGKQKEFISVIQRYSGVMYNAIDYIGMNNDGKKFFENKFLIFSGMYGIVKSSDIIANYKLPIETKGLYNYWGTKIIDTINNLEVDYVVNLLPISYAKLIFGNNKAAEKKFNEIRKFGVININFLKPDGKKISHGVKKIKGEWIKNISEKNIIDYKKFGGNLFKKDSGFIDVNIII